MARCWAPVSVSFWSVLLRAVRWQATSEMPSVATFVVSNFFILCPAYPTFVSRRPYNCPEVSSVECVDYLAYYFCHLHVTTELVTRTHNVTV